MYKGVSYMSPQQGHVTSGDNFKTFSGFIEAFAYARSMELFLFVRSVPLFHARRDEQEGRSLTRSTKATASQIALLVQSQRTLFIHYLFPGSAIVAGHCKER